MKPKSRPKYLQVKDRIIEIFRNEDYQPGQKLPTEFEMVDEFNVSRTTVRQALALLEKDKLIRVIHGSGSYFVGYNPAKENSHSNKGLIGLINFFYMSYIYPEIVRGIEDTISEAGYSLILSNCNRSDEKQIEVIKRLLDQGISGLIFEPNRNQQIEPDNPVLELIGNCLIPVVTTHWGIASKKVSTVTIDDIQAGYDAARYLIERGHIRLGIVYKEDVQAGYDRNIGFCKACQEAEIEVQEKWVYAFSDDDENTDLNQGYFAMKKIMANKKDRPSAVFFFNDQFALQGYDAISEMGLKIPEDISVIGFDNFPNTELVRPGLTTFEHPKYNLGKWAAKILLEELGSEDVTMPIKMVFEPILVERESVLRIK